jgi:hypothetical protein
VIIKTREEARRINELFIVGLYPRTQRFGSVPKEDAGDRSRVAT